MSSAYFVAGRRVSQTSPIALCSTRQGSCSIGVPAHEDKNGQKATDKNIQRLFNAGRDKDKEHSLLKVAQVTNTDERMY